MPLLLPPLNSPFYNFPQQPIQVRCLLEKPVLVKAGQTISGSCILRCNTRQSYDVEITIGVEGSNVSSSNVLDLKNPFFRYTGQPVAAPPGNATTSPTDNYWSTVTGDCQGEFSILLSPFYFSFNSFTVTGDCQIFGRSIA